jgi:hypothetical protein
MMMTEEVKKSCCCQFETPPTMVSLQPHFDALLKSLPPAPVEQSKLDEAVIRVLEGTKDNTWPENRKTQWEQLLRNDIFLLAVRWCDRDC